MASQVDSSLTGSAQDQKNYLDVMLDGVITFILKRSELSVSTVRITSVTNE